MLRLTNIGKNIAQNTKALKRYFAINCLIGQEVFITPTIVMNNDNTICHLDSFVFTGLDNKKYTTLIMRNKARWCEIVYGGCRCKALIF